MDNNSRVYQLAQKLNLPQNERLLQYVQNWVDKSEPWAEKMCKEKLPNFSSFSEKEKAEAIKRYRLRYILNHLCPSLYHFKKMPDPKMVSMREYNRLMREHMMENSQAEFIDDDGTIIQNAVVLSGKEFDDLIEFWRDCGYILKI